MIQKDRKATLIGISLTLIFAILFTALQGVEYENAGFTIADGVYGSCFYFGTGFHGFHVIIGTLFIGVAFYRIIAYHMTNTHHLGLESSILYWHFVDVVWLFLYVSIYWWGS
jgi:cytochrome c oxidase subunit 3